MTGKYDDIIDLPAHKSKTHPHMSMHDRAAQFAPFAALTGYDEEIRETDRLTETIVDASEDSDEHLNRRLKYLQKHLHEGLMLRITYFQPDEKKAGGHYCTIESGIKKIRSFERKLVLTGGEVIPFDSIMSIEDDSFEDDVLEK